MPTNNEFGFNVIVGGLPLWEYTAKDGSLYIESSVLTEASYKMQIGDQGEEVMVTPYQILIEPHKGTPIGFYFLYIDGKKITRAFIQPGRTRTITGIKNKNLIDEFVFTLPSEDNSTSDNGAAGVAQVGEIEIRMFEAKDTGVTETYRQMEFLPVKAQDSKMHNTGRSFNSVSKHELQKRTKGKYPLLHTEAGKAVSYTQHGTKLRQRRVYTEGPLLSVAKVYYRPRLALEILGIITPEKEGIEKETIDLDSDDAVPDTKSSPTQSSTDKNDDKSTETASPSLCDSIIVLDDSQTDIEISSESCSDQFTDRDSKSKCLADITNVTNQMTALSPVSSHNIKREVLSAAGYSNSDCELCLWTEDEPSILCDGDEDCRITLIRKPWDISVLELSDDDDQEDTRPVTRSRTKSSRRQSVPLYAK